uniref:Potassium channel toxin alpha-KTx 27.1 n=1 Tax=Buthus israelis TaxID=2899555 RepID=KA271_BUTIS|nr:RecName: Full=Potassium channel toxin alpha-KTx 27.1; AltName: Full=Toxin BoiTx771; Short=Toxin Tx771; Flags: Precursor [Buthus occitanus israelis]ACJ23153.1 putative potassium channel toxin Tx771 [Buthus occitanus israelis]
MKFLFLTLFVCCFIAVLVIPSEAQIDINVSCRYGSDCAEPCKRLKCLLPSKCINGKCTCYPSIKIKNCKVQTY